MKKIKIISILYLASAFLNATLPDNNIYPTCGNKNFEINGKTLDLNKRTNYTTILLESDIYQSFLKSNRKISNNSREDSNQMGDTLSFYVRSIFDQSIWESVLAELIFDTTSVSIWIEKQSKDSLLSQYNLDSVIQCINSYLFNRSGEYSVNQNTGIINLMHEYFGAPPDIDSDGKLDILLLDIKELFSVTGSYVSGFFDPNDLLVTSTSNQRDLIYIDIYPTILYDNEITIERAIPTVAHEYQHLIHANYEGSNREYIFVNEGLAEMAEIICGFTPRSAQYHFLHPERSLTSWNFENPLPDYSRASLWTHYFFEQIGNEYISNLVQSPETGLTVFESLSQELLGLSINEIFNNWLIAQTINNVEMNQSYGFLHPLRSNIILPRKVQIDALPNINGVSLEKLSAFPFDIPLIKEFNINMSTPNKFHIVDTYYNQFSQIQFDFPSQIRHSLDDGQYGNSLVWLLNDQLPTSEYDNSEIEIDFLISGEKSGIPVILSHDDGTPDIFINQASYLLLDTDEVIAVRFEPDNSDWINGFEIDLVFLSEIQGSGISSNSQRNIIYQIVEDNFGEPGASLTPEILHNIKRPFGNLKSEKINLVDYYPTLDNYDDNFHILIKNNIENQNYFAIGLDSSANYDATQLFTKQNQAVNYSWASLNEIKIGQDTLSGWNAMVRAEVIKPINYSQSLTYNVDFNYDFSAVNFNIVTPFEFDTNQTKIVTQLPSGSFYRPKLRFQQNNIHGTLPLEIGGDYITHSQIIHANLSDATDSVFFWQPPLPTSFSVNQNYPNPFNNNTTIPFILMETGEVTLQIFDILGREVFVQLFNEIKPGVHYYQLDTEHFSSSIYFTKLSYSRLRDGKSSSEVIKMTLIK